MIGVVSQVMSLLNDTIRANIAYGTRDATNSELDDVAQSVHALPEGWDTIVGDRGLKFSGEEKQRTCQL